MTPTKNGFKHSLNYTAKITQISFDFFFSNPFGNGLISGISPSQASVETNNGNGKPII